MSDSYDGANEIYNGSLFEAMKSGKVCSTGSNNNKAVNEKQVDDNDTNKRDFKLKLVSLYRENRVLWEVENANYHDRDKRNTAYQEICSAVGLTKKQVVNAINALRTQFFKEHRIITEKLPTGSGTSARNKSEWWLYKDLLFLADHAVARPSTSNIPNLVEETVDAGCATAVQIETLEQSLNEQDVVGLDTQNAAADTDTTKAYSWQPRSVQSDSAGEDSIPKVTRVRQNKCKSGSTAAADEAMLQVARELVGEVRHKNKFGSSQSKRNLAETDEDVSFGQSFGQMIANELKTIVEPSRKRRLKQQLTQFLYGTDWNLDYE